MARYGTQKYGTFLYGSTDATDDNLLWSFLVDWDDDGLLSGRNEAGRVIDFYVRRGRDNLLRISGDGVAAGFENVSPASAVIVLDDYDNIYNPYNVNSPLYPNVKPGHQIYVKVRNGVSGEDKNVFTGYITDIQPSGGNNRTVTIKAEDGLKIIAESDIDIALSQSISQGDAIQSILDEIGYQWGYELDNVSDTLDYFWASGKALTVIRELKNSELGEFFVAADGKAKYYSRHHGYIPDITIDEAILEKTINLPQPWEVVRNKIKILAYPREEQAQSTLWLLSTKPSIGAGETLTIWATYSYGSESPVPAVSVITPVITTDYLFNSAADGSGSNLSSDLSITFYDFGSTARIDIRNNGASLGYVTLLQVRGNAIASPDVLRITKESGNADKTLVMDLVWLQDANVANDFGTYLLAWLQNVQIFPTVKVDNRFDYQFGIDLFDAVTFQSDYLNVNETFKVTGIEHRWTRANGQSTKTTMTFEPLPSFAKNKFWTFPAELGVTTILGF